MPPRLEGPPTAQPEVLRLPPYCPFPCGGGPIRRPLFPVMPTFEEIIDKFSVFVTINHTLTALRRGWLIKDVLCCFTKIL
jgi:hypothetical protein